MRLIPIRLKPDVAIYLKKVSKRFSVQDPGFTEDLFIVVKSMPAPPIPDPVGLPKLVEEEAKRLGRNKSAVRSLLGKRRQLLMAIASAPSVQRAVKQKMPPLELLNRALTLFRQLFGLIRASKCLTCPLINNCQFGTQYGTKVRDVTKVIDADFSRKVHNDCPLLPEITMENQIASSNEFLSQIDQAAMIAAGGDPGGFATELEQAQQALEQNLNSSDPDEEDDDYSIEEELMSSAQSKKAGKRDVFDVNDEVGTLTPLPDAFINDLSAEKLVLYQLAMRFEAALEADKTINFKPVAENEMEKQERTIQSISDVTKVKLSEHLKSDEMFEKQLHSKELLMNESLRPDTKKQLLHILVDVSGSMSGEFSRTTAHGPMITRASLASALTIALLRKLKRDGAIAYLRRFEGKPDKLQYAVTPKEFDDLALVFARCRFDGGGTCITSAIKAAVADINGKVKPHISNAEILMITDAEDSFDGNALRTILGNVPLNVLDVSGDTNKKLESLSDNYFAANKKSASVADIISIVGGKKKVTNATP